MAAFKRSIENLKANIANEDLFKKKLYEDINKNKIFFAIRGGYCSFYFANQLLFKYDKDGFSTHYKFASVPCGKIDTYITEKNLKEDIKIETSFTEGYEKIKERIALYSSDESKGISALYKFSPTKNNKDERYFLVDIEVALNAKNDDAEKQNNDEKGKIDILLYDNEKYELLFCEAKHFSNKEIWSKKGSEPKVVGQLEKYNELISDNKDVILNEYANAFKEYNDLIGSDLKSPKSIHKKCGLLVFGFDDWQKDKIEEFIKDDESLSGHNSKFIGDILKNTTRTNTNTAENIFKELTKD